MFLVYTNTETNRVGAKSKKSTDCLCGRRHGTSAGSRKRIKKLVLLLKQIWTRTWVQSITNSCCTSESDSAHPPGACSDWRCCKSACGTHFWSVQFLRSVHTWIQFSDCSFSQLWCQSMSPKPLGHWANESIPGSPWLCQSPVELQLHSRRCWRRDQRRSLMTQFPGPGTGVARLWALSPVSGSVWRLPTPPPRADSRWYLLCQKGAAVPVFRW